MAEGSMTQPMLGDIWVQDDGEEYFLFLSQPSYKEGEVYITALNINTGEIRTHQFGIDPETGTLYDWWIKVA